MRTACFLLQCKSETRADGHNSLVPNTTLSEQAQPMSMGEGEGEGEEGGGILGGTAPHLGTEAHSEAVVALVAHRGVTHRRKHGVGNGGGGGAGALEKVQRILADARREGLGKATSWMARRHKHCGEKQQGACGPPTSLWAVL
jgi:hypothetical protein